MDSQQSNFRNNDIERKAHMEKAMKDKEDETTNMLKRAKVERNDIAKITLEIKKIEKIIDNKIVKIVSARINLWNSKPQKAISGATRPTASSLARDKETRIAASSVYASRGPASRMPVPRMPAPRMASIPEVDGHTRWVQRSANRNKKHPGEESKLKNEITSTLIQSERNANDIIESQKALNFEITHRIAGFRDLLARNLLDENVRVAGDEGIIKQYFLDHPAITESITQQKDDLNTIETYKTKLINLKNKLEKLVQDTSPEQDTSPKQDTSLPQNKRLSQEFTKLYEKYKTTATNPKEIPEYFNCSISTEPIMFPLSWKDENGHVFTYESEWITKVITDGGDDPLTRRPTESIEYKPDPIFDSLLDEFIIDPEAYYENYDAINYKTAHLQEEKGLTKDEATMHLKNAHLQEEEGLTKNEMKTQSAGKRKQKNKTYKSYKKNKQTNKRRKVKKYKFKYTKKQRTKNKEQRTKNKEQRTNTKTNNKLLFINHRPKK